MVSWSIKRIRLAVVGLGVCHAAIESACGCSWNGKRCVVSADEVIRAYTQSKIDLACIGHRQGNYSFEAEEELRDKTRGANLKAATIAECEARFHSHSRLEAHRQCIHASTQAACEVNKPYCSWSAQKEGSCGIATSFAITTVVGAAYVDNPYVKILLAQEECPTKAKKKDCEPRAWCEWRPQNVPCTPNLRAFFMSVLKQRPDLLVFIQLLEGNAHCRASYELTHRCSDPRCRLELGICRQREEGEEKAMHNQMHVLQQVLCHHQFGTEICESPCRKKKSHCKMPASVPTGIRQAKANVSKSDWELYWKLLHLRIVEFQHRLCKSAHLHNPQRCGAVHRCKLANETKETLGSSHVQPALATTSEKDTRLLDDDDEVPGYAPSTAQIISEKLPLLMLAGALIAFCCLLGRDVDRCLRCCRRRTPVVQATGLLQEDTSMPLM